MGSAPTYDLWRVELELRDSAGHLAYHADTGVNLESVLPGTRAFARMLRLPRLRPGSYTVDLVVRDPAGHLSPMNLAVTGRRSDGSYPLGTVTLTR